MELILFIVAGVMAIGVIVYSIIIRYTTLRSGKVIALLVGLIVSVPVLAFCLYVIIAKDPSAEAKMWALGICGILFGFWFKNPWREVAQA